MSVSLNATLQLHKEVVQVKSLPCAFTLSVCKHAKLAPKIYAPHTKYAEMRSLEESPGASHLFLDYVFGEIALLFVLFLMLLLLFQSCESGQKVHSLIVVYHCFAVFLTIILFFPHSLII